MYVYPSSSAETCQLTVFEVSYGIVKHTYMCCNIYYLLNTSAVLHITCYYNLLFKSDHCMKSFHSIVWSEYKNDETMQ